MKKTSTKNLVGGETIEQLSERVWHGAQKFYQDSLAGLIEFKVWLGHTVRTSSLWGQYGEGLVDEVAKHTHLKKTVIYESVKMFEEEQLEQPKNQKLFLDTFTEQYSSWNDYKEQKGWKKLSAGGGKSECKHCPIHCDAHLVSEE